MTTPDATGQVALERFLVAGAPLPDAATLDRHHLRPLAYVRSSQDEPDRAPHRPAYLQAMGRHLAHKAAVLPLLRAWHDAGVPAIVFKGFYLAEFVYRTAAERHYSDVDLAVPEAAWPTAERAARALGWVTTWSRRDSIYRHSHEEAVLERAGIVVEVHRFLIDCASPVDRVQRRITEAAWRASQSRDWEGTRLGILAPTDSMLLGLALARSWSGGDDWHLKAADYPDLVALTQTFGVTREDLLDRAADLGCRTTLELFLRRCDPWREHLDLRPPTRAEKRRWTLAVAPERGHLGLERTLNSLRRVPGTLVDTLAQLPALVRTQRRLARDPVPPPPPPPARSAAPAAPAPLHRKEAVVRGIKWGARLLQPGRDPCVLRSVALRDALAANGFDARLRLGVQRHPDGERRHAWVEVEGVSLRDLEDVAVCPVDEVLACYPSPGRDGAPGGDLREARGSAMP